jgi:hypothetical protein
MTMPSELKNASFISDAINNRTTVYKIKGLSFVAEQVTGSSLISAEQEHTGQAQIVQTGTTYSLLLNGAQVYATSSAVLGVTVSPDGTQAVIGEGAPANGGPAPAFSAAPTVHPDAWTSVLVHLNGNGAPHAIGNGIAAFFIDATHVIRTDSVGLVSVDISTGVSKILVPQMIQMTIPTTLTSPDKTHIGWFDLASHSFVIYSVTPDAAQKVATLPAVNPKTSFALGNTALYTVHVTGIATEVKSQSLSGGAAHTVAVLPGKLRITRILLGSL